MNTVHDSTVLKAVDVAVSYGDVQALTASSFSVDAGELIAVVGPNGAGKSTLFKALAGFIDHDGDVVVHGEQCHHLERQAIAYIPQQSDVDLRFPITVAEVVMAGRRRFHGVRMHPSRSDHNNVADCLSQVDLADMGSRSLATLSGGKYNACCWPALWHKKPMCCCSTRHCRELMSVTPANSLNYSLSYAHGEHRYWFPLMTSALYAPTFPGVLP